MKKAYAAILALGLATSAFGCKGLPGGECKMFAQGQLDPKIEGEAKAFVEFALKIKKLQTEFNAEVTAMAGELKVEATPDAVLGKIQKTFASARAEGKCEIEFSADVDLKAAFEAKASGKAGTGEGAKAEGDAKGEASVSVNVKIEPKCSGEFAAKADLDLTVGTIKAHFPKLMATTKAYIDLMPEAIELAGKAEGVVKSVGTNLSALAEAKCAVEAVTGIKADVDVQVNFSVKAQASAKAEGSAEGKAG